MMAKVINGRIVSCYSKEELKKQKEEKAMADVSTDVLLESLRVNLDKVQKEKMELENKELEIKKQIDKLTQGE